ncbi:MAG: DNA internalization-related competence protein ComEC/Rec2 [Kangiellaceae bacterium]|nr:DNA internalization-related competence protein ComEC/Rec2 [Kangiellaceae bacterium]
MKGICVALLLGLSSLFWLQDQTQVYLLLASSGVLLSCLLFVNRYYLHLNSTISIWKAGIYRGLLAFFVGCLIASFSAYLWLTYSSPLIPQPGLYSVKGYICSLPKFRTSKLEKSKSDDKQQFSASFDLCLTHLEDHEINFMEFNKLKLNLYNLSSLEKGNFKAGRFFYLRTKLKPIHGRLNPGGFDYQKWLFSEGYLATGYIKSWEQSSNRGPVYSNYHRVRQNLYDRLNRVVTEGPSKGVILALAMGERSQISEYQNSFIKGSGTAHLLAISGLHIGIAAVWSYYLLMFVFSRIHFLIRYIPAQRLASLGSLLSALSVALISGFEYPAQRAMIMLVIFFLVRWHSRQLSLGNVLATAVIIICLIQPFAILSVGFWLSVFAVGLIALLLSYRQQTNGRYSNIKDWLRINWYLFLGLLPISWFVFDQISFVGIVANVILIPVTSFITAPLIYLALLSLFFDESIASFFFYLSDFSVLFTLEIQSYLASLNSEISVPSISVWLFILLSLLVIILLLPSKFPARSLASPIVAVLLLKLFLVQREETLKLLVFDIGQGLAILVTVGDKQLLYDTGYGNQDFAMADSVLLPYFKRKSITRIDKLVISHKDSDHSGGALSIIESMDVNELLIGEKVPRLSGYTEMSESCHHKDPWQWNKIHFEFIKHLPTNGRLGNNASCVLLIKSGQNRILLPGDIERKAEMKIVANGISPVNILVAPHHGSETSSSRELLDLLNPQIVIFSAGFANQWNFPREKVVTRYRRYANQLLTTFDSGGITIKENELGELTVNTERSRNRHFWNQQR